MKIYMFAGAAEIVGDDQLELELPLPTTAREIKKRLAQVCPRLESLLAHSRLAVDAEYVDDDSAINTDGEIALIPPVSGG